MNTPDPEMKSRKPKRRFTVEYKLEILKRAEECKNGELAALLRKEGLYYSAITRWRRQYDQGILETLGGNKKGRKTKEVHPLERRVKQLEKEKRMLERKLEQAEKIIEFQKKIAELLEIGG